MADVDLTATAPVSAPFVPVVPADASGVNVTATGGTIPKSLADWQATGPVAADGTLVTATGTTTPRTAADRAADVIKLRDFGVVGDGVADDTLKILEAHAQAVATKRVLDWHKGTFKVTANLDLSGCSHVGAGAEDTLIHWYGAGTCVTWSSGLAGRVFRGFGIVGKGGQGSGQNGFLCNGYEGPVIEHVTVLDVDGIGFRIGNTPAGAGVYFGHVNYIRCRNTTVTGAVGFWLDGGGGSNSNSNQIRNVFTKGHWARHYAILGNANVLMGCDAEPTCTVQQVDEVLYVAGTGNVWLGLYLEPTGAVSPTYLCKFAATAQSNRVHHVYSPSAGQMVDAKVLDGGTNNEIVFNPAGSNFAARGRNQSPFNHLPNPEFRHVATTSTGNIQPAGWTLGQGVYTREAGYRSKYAMRVDVVAQKAGFVSFVATNNPVVRNALGTPTPVGVFRDRTVWAGCWVQSSTPGLGCVRINGAGVQQHSGSGNWEWLVACVRVPAGVTEVPFEVINNSTNSNATGTFWIEHPIVVVGNDLPNFAPKSLVDGGAFMAGPLVWAPPRPVTSGTTTPDVADGNIFRPENLVATSITNLLNPSPGQEIKLVPASAGAVTCLGVLAGDTVTLAGIALAAVAGAPGANQFSVDGGDNATAADLARCINAVNNGVGAFGYGGTSLKLLVAASAVANVVRILCSRGEAFPLVSSDGVRLAVSGPALVSNTTLVHNNATLMTTTGANKVLTAGAIYRLFYDGFKWREF